MKWIDDQDDYFLRDFDGKKDGSDDNNAAGSTTPADDKTTVENHDSPTGGAAGSSDSQGGSEFSFHDTDTATSASAAASDTARTKRRRRHRRLAWFFIIVFAVLAVAFYIRYFVPYTSDTLTTGYVTLVEKRGIFFKTFEGEMISESMLADTARVYERDFYFSIPNDSLGRLVQSYQGTGKRVTLTTQKYFGTLPWRGSQKTIVTGVSPYHE